MIGQRKLLTPQPGLVIRDPGNRGKPLPEKGRVVVVDEFWSRRIAAGDVVVSDPPARAAQVEVAAGEQPVELGAGGFVAVAAEVEANLSALAGAVTPVFQES